MLNLKTHLKVILVGLQLEDKEIKMKRKKKIKLNRMKEQLIQQAMKQTKSYWNEKLSKMENETIQCVTNIMKDVFSNYKER